MPLETLNHQSYNSVELFLSSSHLRSPWTTWLFKSLAAVLTHTARVQSFTKKAALL